MKNLFLTILVVGCVSSVFAQQGSKAKKILDELSKATESHEVIQVDFKIEYKNINEDTQNSSKGSIIMKENKYRLNFMETESFFDGKTLWDYIPEVKEVNITEPEPDDEDIFSNPRKIFTIYENGYKFQLIESTAVKGVNYSIIDLFPFNLNEEYSRIRLSINTDENFLSSATIFGKEGSHFILNIDSYKTDLKTEDSYFTFNEASHPDVEIIDMRW